jgi:hypothetical protein
MSGVPIVKANAIHRMKQGIRCTLVILSLAGATLSAREYPVGVTFHEETLTRKGVRGDNWCQTWASDGNMYTMMDDGNGWWEGPQSGSLCLQIRGDEGFTAADVKRMPGWPENAFNSSFYAYGTVSVDGVIYVWLWKSETKTWYRRPIANRLLYSPDLGQTFYRWTGERETAETFEETDADSFFFYREDPRPKIDRDAYAFNWIAFCQNGRDNSLAKDNYVYMYAPEQYDPRNLSTIRVPKPHLRDKSKYEYFKAWNGGAAEWTRDMKQRGVNLRYPERRSDGEWMWPSWFPCVVYNPGLDLYIMVSYGVTDKGKTFWDGWCSKCLYPSSLGFWYAERPWGPWKRFHYTEYFYGGGNENRTYGFKLSPKWISDDGRTMVLIWSDAGQGHGPNYRWNQMRITLGTKEQ